MSRTLTALWIWWGWRRHHMRRRRDVILRRLAFRAYALAGDLGGWARCTFGRTEYLESGRQEDWNLPLPAASEPVKVDYCGTCGQPLSSAAP